MNEYDYIVIGSGIAGLYTALLAKEHGSVLILTKGTIDECNTKHAQGGIAAAIGPWDSSDLHYQDTMAAGDGLCDPEAVRILVHEAPDRITDLMDFDVPFDTLDGEIALAREGAHSVPRILHAGGDATGERIEVTLSNRARRAKIVILEHCLATQVIVEDGVAKGVRAIDCHTGSCMEYACRSVILATGGAGRLYRFTTNPEVATADGIALAYNAGAEISDMEFFQFHPTALRVPGMAPFLISEAVRGEGGLLRNVDGRRFMYDYSDEGELAPRDVVARGILFEMRKTRSDHVLLDVIHFPPRTTSARFPTIYRFCQEHGLDITRSPIPVAPAAHYMMGGIKTNSWGETNIAGLFAAGETACTGVHGANRLASNSLLEVLVFAKRIVERSRGETHPRVPAKEERYALPQREAGGDGPSASLPDLQALMWDKVGIVRCGPGLEQVVRTLARWQEASQLPCDRPSYELSSLILAARLTAEAALLRQESRGAHFRSDFPRSSSDWLRHIVFKKSD